MSEFGLQTFIKGTSFDVLNSMDYDFVFDVIRAPAGAGSRDYSSYPPCDFDVAMVNASTASSESSDLTFGQNGNVVNWTLPRPMTIAIRATPKVGAAYPGNDFTFQARAADGTLKIAPNFTPFCLVDVLDFTPVAGGVYQTKVPAGRPVLIFQRGQTQLSNVLFFEEEQNGYVSIRVSFQASSIPIRVYVFSNYMVNIPDWGLFMYRNNEIVWHSNCLPLKLETMRRTASGTSIIVNTTYPTAIQSTISANRNLRLSGTQYMQIYYASAAGWRPSSNDYMSHLEGYPYIQNPINAPTIPSGWGVPGVGYINTTIYDTYYQQALGLI